MLVFISSFDHSWLVTSLLLQCPQHRTLMMTPSPLVWAWNEIFYRRGEESLQHPRHLFEACWQVVMGGVLASRWLVLSSLGRGNWLVSDAGGLKAGHAQHAVCSCSWYSLLFDEKGGSAGLLGEINS